MNMASAGQALRGSWRLLRLVTHVLHGVWVAAREFGAATEAQRCAHIQWWAARLLQVLGIALQVDGRFANGPQLLVSNHVSWLDILAVHAVCPQARFVSKADVRGWPLLGWLVGKAGTLFIERENKRDALRVVHQMAEALRQGDTVAVFPEGTTGDGHALLPFHANLLQAAVATGVPAQPLALRYGEPGHSVSPAAMWVGDTTLLQSLWRIVTTPGLSVHVAVLSPQATTGLERRGLATVLRNRISAALDAG
jgi:1-acyl-sn-glycerol-3-phosphate acyltransferase